ncbi:transposase (plasmid) [Arsenophonus nasoniae]|uniref:Transposase n=1 Tax=Arsenophonus nasoniae TaxID=638 RepID=A0ABY8NYU1_9GAMM|nr:transposase [Arsenophonus nasoniae]WGM08449.1 transposase [Arsenophonus nasoniae]WGM13367.1 transposase [Arsenophonus nasoniae]
MLQLARKQGIEIGIFCALHTYGRQLNQHPHVHVSVTRGGLDSKHSVWRKLFFKKRMSKKSGEGCYPTTASQL